MNNIIRFLVLAALIGGAVVIFLFVIGLLFRLLIIGAIALALLWIINGFKGKRA